MKYIDSVTTSDQPATVYACTMAHLALFYETSKIKVTSNSIGATYTLVPNSASWFGGVASMNWYILSDVTEEICSGYTNTKVFPGGIAGMKQAWYMNDNIQWRGK
jgi:hypothetical protein